MKKFHNLKEKIIFYVMNHSSNEVNQNSNEVSNYAKLTVAVVEQAKAGNSEVKVVQSEEEE